jgi:copper resistance protein B
MKTLLIALVTTVGLAQAMSAAAQSHQDHQAPATPPVTQDRASPQADDPLVGHDTPATPAEGADPHAGHDMPMMDMPMPGMGMPRDQGEGGAADPHAGHDMPGMMRDGAPAPSAADPHTGHDAGAETSTDGALGTALPAGDAAPPPIPTDFYADRSFSPAEMARARDAERRAHGGGVFSQVIVDIAEYRATRDGGSYAWDAEAWFGGDINRLTLKSEGEGQFRNDLESAEVQALYSRALDPYWNLQVGVRYDFEPSRAYAAVGFEGLAPYWFELEGALFLSDRGDLLARLGGYHDLRLTQRLILQPRAEINFAAQDVPRDAIGSGVSDVEIGLRLRYEIAREFAPYVGVSWERKLGDTARFARANGDDVGGAHFVTGIRFWF